MPVPPPRPTTDELAAAMLEAMIAIERVVILMARIEGCTCEPTVSFKQNAWPLEWRVSHALCPLAGQGWIERPEIPRSWLPN